MDRTQEMYDPYGGKFYIPAFAGVIEVSRMLQNYSS